MTQRDTVVVLIGILFVAVLSVVLVSSAAVTQRPPESRPRVLLGRSPLPSARPLPELERRLPPGATFLRPFVGVQRDVSDASRAAQGLILLLLLVAGTLVLARDAVARVYGASAGGWRVQARVAGIGLGVLVAIASVLVLAWSLTLGLLAGRGELFVLGLQVQLATIGVVLLLIAAIALLGFSAAAWRVGTRVLDVSAWRRFGERTPAPVAALLGATLLYLGSQLPVVGPAVAVALLAYSLGAFVHMRLVPAGS